MPVDSCILIGHFNEVEGRRKQKSGGMNYTRKAVKLKALEYTGYQ